MLETIVWNNTVRVWMVAAVTFLIGAAALIIFKRIVAGRIRRIAERTHTDWDNLALDLVERTRVLTLILIAALITARMLVLPARGERVLEILTIVMLAIQTAVWGNGIVSFGISRAIRAREDGASRTTLAALDFLSRAVLWIIILALTLDNLGFEISTLLTGLGIGGIAVALAVQNVLGDIFGALSIVLDKPFVVGDTIHIDTFVGTVEHIGIKTTRLRSIYGEQLVFSNSDLLKGRIRNYKRMSERRVDLRFGVIYQTSPDDIAAIPGIVRQVIEGVEGTRFDRAHFRGFGDSSLDFETVWWVLSPDYAIFMERQQAINLGILRAFEGRGISFAYPTRTLHVVDERSGESTASSAS